MRQIKIYSALHNTVHIIIQYLLNNGEDRGRAGTLLSRGEDRGRAGTPAKDRGGQGQGWNTS